MNRSLIIFFSLLYNGVIAQSICGGTIRYEIVSGLTVQTDISVWLCEPSDSINLVVDLGDGTTISQTAQVDSVEEGVCHASTQFSHTYSGPSIVANRVFLYGGDLLGGICNIPNSSSSPLYLEENFKLNGFVGLNSSPTISTNEWDTDYQNGLLTQAVTGIDSDGDSLSYEIIAYQNTPGYSIPSTFNITDEGIFTYEPVEVCDMLAAVEISEWRNNSKIGSIMRFMVLRGTVLSVPEYGVDTFKNLVYPNPANKQVIINQMGSTYSQVLITDMAGRIILQMNMNNTSDLTKIDATDWPSGIYFVSVLDKDGIRHSEKLIVAHD
ncbi:MAG: T9SS type A sorting domain-containing protein [Flavobacteriales bacterium]|nr:T9SS type A sorting domain-containing protein [Flavobacteriales bacterium]